MKIQRRSVWSIPVRVGLALALLTMAMGILGAPAAHATSMTVNTLSPEQNTDGLCSLIEAVVNADNDDQSGSTDCPAGSGHDVIDFAVTGTITLTNWIYPDINDSLTIVGPGPDLLTIDADGAPHVFSVGSLAFPQVSISGLTITGGSAAGSSGGGIECWVADLALTDVVFRDNIASDCGGLYHAMNAGNLTLTDVVFVGNHSDLQGGGLCVETETGQVTLTRVRFEDNYALWEGGGMFNEAAGATLNYVEFVGNSARNGGGLYASAGGPMTLTHTIFFTNTAFDDLPYSGAEGRGGGVNMGGGNNLLEDVTFRGNVAEQDGGGVFNDGEATLRNVTFENNTAAAGGGGVYNTEGNGDMVLESVLFTGNSADHGGGMANKSDEPLESSVSLSTVLFQRNSATYGGGFYNEEADATLSFVIFSDNSAAYGGGAYQLPGGSQDLVVVSFFTNTATVDGGGLYNSNSPVTLAHAAFFSNTAGYDGGGMYNTGFLGSGLVDVEFQGNSAASAGGGLYNAGSQMDLTDLTFHDNQAAYGGGMLNFGSYVTLTNNIFTDNAATSTGGGLYNGGHNLTVTHGLFTGNSAVYAGGLFNQQWQTIVRETTFSSNTADYGGGLYNYDGAGVDLECVTFDGNTADQDGGGMINEYNSAEATLKNVTFSGNTANGAGGALFTDLSDTTLAYVTMVDNGAASGGGIYNNGGNVGVGKVLLGRNAAASGPDCSGFVDSQGYNLIQNPTGCSIVGDLTGNFYGLDPKVDPLADNGGWTETRALQSDSLAREYVPVGPYCTAGDTDQRGAMRAGGNGQGGSGCDVGAYEDENQPTAVDLVSFTAVPVGGAILLEWETASELDTLGFNLYRSDTGDPGSFVRLNGELIPSQVPGSPLGATYEWTDAGVEADQAYFYLLEDVDVYGQATPHGPVSARLQPTAMHQIYLPFVNR